MSKNCKRVRSNLLQQDIYVREYLPPFIDNNDYLVDNYVSQDRVTENFERDGAVHSIVRDKVHLEEYPINPKSVNSFADSVNYKLDVFGATQSKPKTPNLGDVASIKELFEMSADDLKAFFDNAYSKIAESRKVSNVESEVNNNG